MFDALENLDGPFATDSWTDLKVPNLKFFMFSTSELIAEDLI